MNKQRQQLVEDNMNLVYFIIRKKFPRFIHDEDLVQTGMLGLCKAGEYYDETKGAFSTFASKCILSYIYKELNSRDASKDVDITSLNYEIVDDSGKKTELGDFLVGDTDVDYVDISALYDKVSPLDKQILDLKTQGFTQKQTAKKLGYSAEYISQRVRYMKRLYDQIYGGNDG